MMRILLTEGSSLSARQTISALGPLGYRIDVLDNNPYFCIARHSRFVRRCIRVPSFRLNPWGYYESLLKQLQQTHYDVLLPTHDQVYLLSRCQEELKRWTHVAVPAFQAIQQVQSKLRFVEVLDRLRLPHPATQVVEPLDALIKEDRFPFYIKLPYSTAGQGVWKIEDEPDRHRVVEQLQRDETAVPRCPVIVQQPANGRLSVVQSVSCQGTLLACHCYQARELGVGGSAVARVSVHHPQVMEDVRTLVRELNWHGAMMLDYLFDEEHGPSYIDCNPRIGETYNATLSGTPLCELLVQTALEQARCSRVASHVGVQTHSVMMQLLAANIEQPTRRRLINELRRALLREGMYANSTDEVTLPSLDIRSLIPACYVAVQLLLAPGRAQRLTNGTVQNYSLDAETVRQIEMGPPGSA